MKYNIEQKLWLDNIPIGKGDIPDCTIPLTDSISTKTPLSDDYNLIDYTYGRNRYINLSDLMNATDEEAWQNILKQASQCDSVTIVNDIVIRNKELSFITDFYIGVFYSSIKSQCPKCYLYNKIIIFSDSDKSSLAK